MKREYVPIFSSICKSEKLADLADDASRLFYVLLLTQCDSHGRITGRPRGLCFEVWAMFGHTAEETERAIADCERVGLLEVHELDGDVWIQVPDWDAHAGRVGRREARGKSKWPEPTTETRRTKSRKPRATPTASAPKSEPSADSVRTKCATEERREEKSRGEFPASPDAASAPPGAEASPAPRKPRTAPTPTGPHAEVAAWFSAEFERSTGKPYAFEGGKDGAAVRSILQRAGPGGLAEVQERGRSFFADQFHRKAGFTLTRFLAAWNALAKPTNAMPTASGSVRALYAEAEQERQRSIDVDGQRVA